MTFATSLETLTRALGAAGDALSIPWFRAEPIQIPLPGDFDIAGMHVNLPDDVAIQPFGLLVATGLIVGVNLAQWRGKRIGLHESAISSCTAHVLITAFIVAHVFDVIAYHPESVLTDPLGLLRIWESLSSFGGFLGAVLGLMIFSKRYDVSPLLVGDVCAFAFPSGWIFGRTGCFSVHDHPGIPTDFFLGVADYHVGAPPYVTRHDLGLYEIFWASAVCALFLWLERQNRERPTGFYLGLLPILYSPVRFGLDFLREDAATGGDARYFGLTPGHYSAIVLLAAGILVMRHAYNSPKPPIPWTFALDRDRKLRELAEGGALDEPMEKSIPGGALEVAQVRDAVKDAPKGDAPDADAPSHEPPSNKAPAATGKKRKR